MKKTLSLILALILTFSMGTLAFAAETATALTKDQAKAAAVAHVNYDSEYALGTYVLSGTYTDDIQGTVEVYNVTSTLLLKSGRTVVYKTVVDKYNGKIYYQEADIKDITSLFLKNITMEQAYSLAIEALGVNADNTVLISQQAIVTDNGNDAYQFVFVEGYSQKFECTVMKYDGSIENIKVSKYTVESTEDLSVSNILEKIILIFKVLIAKLNPANLLDKISATDLLKVFQFLAG